MSFTKTKLAVAASACVTAALMSGPAQAQQKQLTLCWAAWDPANALVELSKDFTAKTGIAMKYEFVPWPNFAQRMLNELNSKGKLCDLIIGDSQWIGGSAEQGHYVKLNDFFAKEGIKMTDFAPATVVGYAEWPKNSPNYWALPAMADAVGEVGPRHELELHVDAGLRGEVLRQLDQRIGRIPGRPAQGDGLALRMGSAAAHRECGRQGQGRKPGQRFQQSVHVRVSFWHRPSKRAWGLVEDTHPRAEPRASQCRFSAVRISMRGCTTLSAPRTFSHSARSTRAAASTQ